MKLFSVSKQFNDILPAIIRNQIYYVWSLVKHKYYIDLIDRLMLDENVCVYTFTYNTWVEDVHLDIVFFWGIIDISCNELDMGFSSLIK